MFIPVTSNNIINQLDANDNIQDKLTVIIDEIMKTNIFTGETQNIGKPRRKRNIWKDEEIKKLIVGVSWMGIGNWSSIHSVLGFDSERTTTDLKDKWRNLVNPKSNSKTQFHFKKLATFVAENINESLKVTGRNYQNSCLDWQNAFHELEMIENQNLLTYDIKNENVEDFTFPLNVQRNQIEDYNSGQFEFELENFRWF
jgi:hypothetical protein